MYKMYEKNEAIREVQKYLQEINIIDSYISPSGIYDETTKQAIVSFQKSEGIPPSGTVKKETFDKLYDAYTQVKTLQNTNDILEQNSFFSTKIGDYGEHIRVLNKQLRALLDYYGRYHELRDTAIYSIETDNAFNQAKEIFGMGIDVSERIFYARLIREIAAITKHKISDN